MKGKAVFLGAFVAAFGGVLFGYDTAVVSGMCLPYLATIWRLVTETTGKSLDEIEAYLRR